MLHMPDKENKAEFRSLEGSRNSQISGSNYLGILGNADVLLEKVQISII